MNVGTSRLGGEGSGVRCKGLKRYDSTYKAGGRCSSLTGRTTVPACPAVPDGLAGVSGWGLGGGVAGLAGLGFLREGRMILSLTSNRRLPATAAPTLAELLQGKPRQWSMQMVGMVGG